MPSRSDGIPAQDLDEATLKQELKHLYETREETFFNGTPQQLETHTDRMLELEREFLTRRPDEAEPEPERTRAGARARAGQDPYGGPSAEGAHT